ncbi:MAG: hypothetical protein ACK47R_15500, partial [Planctomycetia bacterium]
MAMIFAREISPTLTSLVKKIDAETEKNKSAKMGSFVVFLSNDEKGMEEKLKSLASKEGIKNTVLAIDNVAGPEGYNIAKDAEVTVVLYTKRNVKANHAFRKGELNESAVSSI